MKNPEQVFRDRKLYFEQAENRYKTRFNQFSIIRVIVFLAFLVGIIYFANERNFYPILYLSLAFPFVFGLVVNRHNHFRYLRDQAGYGKQINEDELHRLQLKLDRFQTGEQHLERDHPYLVDLDIFGKHSLFQLLNRTITRQGGLKLAGYLKNPPDEPFIPDQQDVIRELTDQLDWRQDFEATGRHTREDEKANQVFTEWLQKSSGYLNNRFRKIYMFTGPLLVITLIILAVFDVTNNYPVYLLFAFHVFLINRIQPFAKETHRETSESVQALKIYQQLISKVENSSFSSSRWQLLSNYFEQDGEKASKSIRKLQFILEQLDGRSNFFYWIFNFIFLLDFHWLRLAELWKLKRANAALKWLDGLAEIDVINSLGGFAFAHPDFSYPSINKKNQRFEALSLGHPLISSAERVANDFMQNYPNQISVITGSNMSGKSTFLRTVGINLILAYLGCPVCASRMAYQRVDVFTSMRTQDVLEEHISSFYAELRRLKMLLQNSLDGRTVFFLLDELLKGTNSGDRHKGAVAFLKKLSQRKVSGLVSTHDVELGALADEIDQVINYHFSSNIDGNQIDFDYKIKEGICKSFNASQLMINLGIMDN